MLFVLPTSASEKSDRPPFRRAATPRAAKWFAGKEPGLTPLTDGVLTVAQIVIVNVVLSGDNALVIGLTARQLPEHLRQRAVLLGSALAVLFQVAFAILVGQLL